MCTPLTLYINTSHFFNFTSFPILIFTILLSSIHPKSCHRLPHPHLAFEPPQTPAPTLPSLDLDFITGQEAPDSIAAMCKKEGRECSAGLNLLSSHPSALPDKKRPRLRSKWTKGLCCSTATSRSGECGMMVLVFAEQLLIGNSLVPSCD